MMHHMLSNIIAVRVSQINEAPVYTNETTMIKIIDVIVVKKGMDDGQPTVDIQCEDIDGKKFMICATGAIINAIGLVNKREMDKAAVLKNQRETMN